MSIGEGQCLSHQKRRGRWRVLVYRGDSGQGRAECAKKLLHGLHLSAGQEGLTAQEWEDMQAAKRDREQETGGREIRQRPPHKGRLATGGSSQMGRRKMSGRYKQSTVDLRSPTGSESKMGRSSISIWPFMVVSSSEDPPWLRSLPNIDSNIRERGRNGSDTAGQEHAHKSHSIWRPQTHSTVRPPPTEDSRLSWVFA